MSGVENILPSDQVPKVRPIFDQMDSHGVLQLQPVRVRLGPQNKILEISDGASALGYIFSVVQPPKQVQVTWSNYFLPLLVLYSSPKVKANDNEYQLVDKLPTISSSTLEAILKKRLLTRKAAVPVNRLRKDDRTKAVHMQLVQDVIARRYAPNFSPTHTAFIAACRELMLFYVQPHVFALSASQPQTQAQSLQEVALTSDENAGLLHIFNPLWESCQTRLVEKLDYLKERQELYEDPPVTATYGRCAETYPMIGLQ
ncbi:hypothetical protein BDU57DRAFT_542906 [Ampelomyces quisqualis]|uniref:Uncharacterized protein n=1 Tax=Ampelomyces quisqualis TaxID=50730 RepID=A0A6A5QBB1_AMPQU|nr:hypothetical protein BDU57DRAFT_542906 [Ampelomyces quisqualis]